MSAVGITIVAKAKHRALYAAAKSAGGVKPLADALGVRPEMLYAWIGLKSAPPLKPGGAWSQERLDDLDARLLAFVGQGLNDLFPNEMRTKEWLALPKVREIDRDVEVRQLLSSDAERLLLPSPAEALESEEVSERIKGLIEEAVGTLSFRERKILTARFGLDGSPPMTLDQVAVIFKVSRARIQQIERRAISRLRTPSRVSLFASVVPDSWNDPRTDVHSVILKE